MINSIKFQENPWRHTHGQFLPHVLVLQKLSLSATIHPAQFENIPMSN